MPSQSCQLLPHQASSESWITACPADRHQHLSDTGNFQDLSCTDARPSSCVCSFLQRRSHDHNLSFYRLLPDAWGGTQDLAALAVGYPDGANWTRDRQPPQAPHCCRRSTNWPSSIAVISRHQEILVVRLTSRHLCSFRLKNPFPSNRSGRAFKSKRDPSLPRVVQRDGS